MDMTAFKTGDKVVTKKPHACGCDRWTVTRVGADVKLKCDKCLKIVLLPSDKAAKAIKTVISDSVKETD